MNSPTETNSRNILIFNINLLESHGSGRYILAFDPSSLSKAGKCTPWTGYFWSGVASKAKWGLEVASMAAVDLELKTAFHLNASQTISLEENEGLPDFYRRAIIVHKKEYLSVSSHITADAYFSKVTFVKGLVEEVFHIISRLRDDADLMYLYIPQKGKGRPRNYEGKVDFKNMDILKLKLVSELDGERIYSGLVYCKSLQMKINPAMVYSKNKNGHISFTSAST